MAFDPRGRTFGRYLIGERLAIGGMGEVRLALQTGPGHYRRTLAIKFLLPHLAEQPDSVQMFLDEAHLAAQLSHPNVVQIFDVGELEGRYYLAMELVQGVSGASLVRALREAGEQLPPEVVLYVARCLLSGLHHAHEQHGPDGRPLEIVHRDVTPHNLLFGTSGEVKLTDFGIAKARERSANTTPGDIKGKLAYLAPEQFSGGAVDRRLDVFSAGLTLYQLATLDDLGTVRAAGLGPSRFSCLAALPPVAALRPDLPKEFSDAIARAMKLKVAERFPTARAFRDAFPYGGEDRAADGLGELVKHLCKDPLGSLERQCATIATRGVETAGLSAAPDPAESATGTVAEHEPGWRALRRASAVIVAALLVTGAAVGGWAVARRDRTSLGAQPPAQASTDGAAPRAEPGARGAPGHASAEEPPAPGPASSPTPAQATGEGSALRSHEERRDRPGPSPAGARLPASQPSPRDAASSPSPAASGSPVLSAPSVPPHSRPDAPAQAAAAAPPAAAGPSGGAAPAPPPRSTAPHTRPSAKQAGGKSPAPTAGTGYLNVNAEPWAHVFINGKMVAETPVAGLQVPAGTLLVRLVCPETKRSVVRHVSIETGRYTFLKVDLR